MGTTVEVFDGNCGRKTVIKALRVSDDALSLEVQTDCAFVGKLAAAIGSNLTKMDVAKPFNQNIIYKKVGEVMSSCVPCVVPAAIVKALWTESGMALKKDAKIQFTT